MLVARRETVFLSDSSCTSQCVPQGGTRSPSTVTFEKKAQIVSSVYTVGDGLLFNQSEMKGEKKNLKRNNKNRAVVDLGGHCHWETELSSGGGPRSSPSAQAAQADAGQWAWLERGASDTRGFSEHPEPASLCLNTERAQVKLKHKSTFGTC